MKDEKKENEQQSPPRELKSALFVNQPKFFPPTVKIKRSQRSWVFHYAFLAAALTIEVGLITLIMPPYWWIWFSLAIGTTTYFVIFNRWFQERLARLQRWIEDTYR